MAEDHGTDVYLMLCRQQTSFETLKEAYAGGATAFIMYVAAAITKGMVRGDSLDAPFLGFIRVTNVKHEIGFEGNEAEKAEYSEGSRQRWTWNAAGWDANEAWYRKGFRLALGSGYLANDNAGGNRAKPIRESFESGPNLFVQSHLPTHGNLRISKGIDQATPQLSFGCSAQEKYPFAIFFFRRRIGLGLQGSRMPYLVMALDKVQISSWSLEGDGEAVAMRYKQIAWAATAQVSDTNVSIPGFTRHWDVEARTGGEGGWALGLQALTAGIVLATSPVAMAIEAAYEKIT